MNTQPQFPRNNNEKPFIFNGLTHNDEFLRADQELHAENQTLIRLKAEIYALSGGVDHKQFQNLIEQFVSHYTPQKEGLELEIAKLKKQIEQAGSSLSIEDIAKILQDIEDKREEDREQFLQNKKVQENLTQEEKDDLKNKFRYLSRLAHPDTSEIENIDPKFLTFLTELKDAGALDVITQIYENIEVRGQSIEQAFSEYMNEKQENKTVSDTQLNIVRVQNEIIKYSKLKELLQQVRGSTEGIQNISKQLDDELDALRNEKVELEKVLEGLKIKDIEQPKDSSDSMVKVIHEVNSKKIEQPSGELSLENQMEKDKKDWEKAKRIMDRFLKDIEKNVFGWEVKHSNYENVFLINGNIKLRYNKNITQCIISEINYGYKSHVMKFENDFKECHISLGHNDEIKYSNVDYYRNLGSRYDQGYDYNHNCTFSEAWSESKNIIKKHLGVDLDSLYGDGSEEYARNRVEFGDSKISAGNSENKIEKRDIWNPKNFEETMEAVKELEEVIKNLTFVKVKHDFGYEIFLDKKNKLNIKFQNYNHNNGNCGVGVFVDFLYFYDAKKSKHFSILKLQQNNQPYLYTIGEQEIVTALDEENGMPNINAPIVFQKLKNKLKEFGIDLDAM
jgi:hypothetical protein